jgi:5-methylcytosine-specific restriction endonuclease McrA
MPLFSDALYESGRKLGAKLAEEKRKKENEEWHETYEQYLASGAWKEKRRLVMLRAQGICEGCRTSPATVVHHLTYKRAMREMLFDLVAVCESCHSACHVDEPGHE